MGKCHIIIVDTVNSQKFNSANVKKIFSEVLLFDSNLNISDNYNLLKSIEFFTLQMNCDKIAIEKSLMKDHLFVNIISTSMIKQLHEKETDDGLYKKSQNWISNLLPTRYYNLLKHAFISKNRNTLFLLLDEEDTKPIGISNYQCEINWMGINSNICQDQLIKICSGYSYETKIQTWFLYKLIALEGNFSFYCLPMLSRLISVMGSDITPLKLNPFKICSQFLNKEYEALIMDRMSCIEITSQSYTVPIFLHANQYVDWISVKRCILEKFRSRNTIFIGRYSSRSNAICQDINFLLVSLLKYFNIFPKYNQLPFTTPQMATLVSECLRSKTLVEEGMLLIIVIEDIDWIVSSCLTNEACSWLPEKCSANIQIIITGAKDSVHEKSLKCRLCPPKFIDVSYPDYLITSFENETCRCNESWCLFKLMNFSNTWQYVLNSCITSEIRFYTMKLIAIFMSSVICALSYSQIVWLLSFDKMSSDSVSRNSVEEKDQLEVSEKNLMNSNEHGAFSLSSAESRNLSYSIRILISSGIIQQISLSDTDEPFYELKVPQMTQYLQQCMSDKIYQIDTDLIKCRLGAYFVYQTTNLYLEILFVPKLLQYLSSVKDATLKDWLLSWPVVLCLRDEFCVPVRLLSLWRSLLGPNTDYKPMINAYIATVLPEKRDPEDCCLCKKTLNFELQPGHVSLTVLRQLSSSDFSPSYCKHRYRILLDLARISMQVGQYAIAKEMARSLLKQLDHLSADRAEYCSRFDSNKGLLASCLHLLFCTLDERLKTFEFVTEQTTPIFRRTVHYGARALLLQNDIVTQIQRTIDNKNKQGTGDVKIIDHTKLQQRLCQTEIRLAHIMTHFVFSLDGVEQTVINRHFTPSEIRSVTYACMTRAYDIAIRLKDRQLLLEIQMTFGVLQPRENFREKILLYKTPLRQALIIYGEGHIFVSRLYINIGISYEEQKKYIKAFEYFTLWSHVTHELLGRNHCKSLRSCGVFKEPIFKVTADFLKSINDEEPNENLEEELSESINNLDVDSIDFQGVDLHVTGLGNSSQTSNSFTESMSIENMFMMRNSLEHESDWEIHSSDDETPNYTTAFEQVIDKFKRSSNTVAKELLQNILNNSLIESDDLSKEEIDCLIQSQEFNVGDSDSNNAHNGSNSIDNSNVTEVFRITRMFRDLRELAQWIPNTNLSPSDISLSRRLLELQRELEEFLDN